MFGRVLIFGDSLAHVGSDAAGPVTELVPGKLPYGAPHARLGQLMLNRGDASAVRIDARVGRSANNFFGREDHEALLAADRGWHPSTVIVALGTNDIGLNLSVDKARMEAIRDAFPDAVVLCIGPPAFPMVPRLQEGLPVVYDMLRQVFRVVVDARPLTPVGGRTGDNIHFTSAAGPYAEALYGAIAKAHGVLPGDSFLPWVILGAGGILVWWRWFR